MLNVRVINKMLKNANLLLMINFISELSEEMGVDGDELMEKDGVTFCCKYLGYSLVADPKGEASTAEAIAHIIAKAKISGQKPARVMLRVSLKGIKVHNADTMDHMLSVSIYK